MWVNTTVQNSQSSRHKKSLCPWQKLSHSSPLSSGRNNGVWLEELRGTNLLVWEFRACLHMRLEQENLEKILSCTPHSEKEQGSGHLPLKDYQETYSLILPYTDITRRSLLTLVGGGWAGNPLLLTLHRYKIEVFTARLGQECWQSLISEGQTPKTCQKLRQEQESENSLVPGTTSLPPEGERMQTDTLFAVQNGPCESCQ